MLTLTLENGFKNICPDKSCGAFLQGGLEPKRLCSAPPTPAQETLKHQVASWSGCAGTDG